MSKSCRYLIMAGGTGGHIFPAMAVAKLLIDRGNDVYWLGTASGMESGIVSKEEIPLHAITIKGFRGKGILAKFYMPVLLLSAIWQSVRIIIKTKPDVVVGFGGYVSAPGGIAAKLLGKKLVVHEQNSVAGTTNKLLAKIASKVLEAFPGSLKNAVLVGNPVRKNIEQLFLNQKDTSDKEKKLLITGGSLGAEAINMMMPTVIKSLPEDIRPKVWHQTGKNKLDSTSKKYAELGLDVQVVEFIADVEEAYRWADIIICRAGALTVSEIAVAGLPAVFIPYPYAIDNHQLSNAQWLVDNQASFLIEQKDLTEEKLSKLLIKILKDNSELNEMSTRLKKIAKPNATEDVVAACERICSGEIDYAA
ncbi:MAG: undecaprenyldiphospho-muramoylpentapeptide beta-N-acetylglucosaminyltransferase [Cellvibrionaceae bacterium]